MTLRDDSAQEPDEGRSPVEEAGREVEGAEDEDLASTVEEGEEAALALGVPPPAPEFPWLPVSQISEEEGDQDAQETSVSVPENQASEASNAGEWDAHCRSPQ